MDFSSLNKSQLLLNLLEGKSTFIINVRATSSSEAIDKILADRKKYKGAELLLQKKTIIRFFDKLGRSLNQLLDDIGDIISNDPLISDPYKDVAGVMQLSPGNWVFFGCGRT